MRFAVSSLHCDSIPIDHSMRLFYSTNADTVLRRRNPATVTRVYFIFSILSAIKVFYFGPPYEHYWSAASLSARSWSARINIAMGLILRKYTRMQ